MPVLGSEPEPGLGLSPTADEPPALLDFSGLTVHEAGTAAEPAADGQPAHAQRQQDDPLAAWAAGIGGAGGCGTPALLQGRKGASVDTIESQAAAQGGAEANGRTVNMAQAYDSGQSLI